MFYSSIRDNLLKRLHQFAHSFIRGNSFNPLNRFVNSYLFVEQGSALIITLLVIMVISAIGIGVGRLTISEIKQTTNLENAVGAEAVAESGIEHGLLLYRFNHNAEVCAEEQTDPTVSCDAKSTPITINMGSSTYYDILMYHKLAAGESETVNTSADGKVPALGQDQTVEYDLTKIDGNLTLKWDYVNTNPTETEIPQMRLEYMAYDQNGEIVGKKLFLYDDWMHEQPLITTGATILRIKSWGADLKDYTLTDGTAEKLDSRYTIIESTGYFGNTKRKLQVKLDRHSGQILGTYDFVLYSGEGSIGQ